MSRDFIGGLNRSIADILDPADPQTIAQRAAVDVSELTRRVHRVVDYAMVYAHAVEFMETNKRAHPLTAFMHAVECMGPDLTGGKINDSEFLTMVVMWRSLCATDKPIKLA
jgi:hypothetical protein